MLSLQHLSLFPHHFPPYNPIPSCSYPRISALPPLCLNHPPCKSLVLTPFPAFLLPIAVIPFSAPLFPSALAHSPALSLPQPRSLPASCGCFSGPPCFTLGSSLPLSQVFLPFVYTMSGLPSPALLQDLPHLESNRDLLRFPDLVITETPTLNI